MGALWFWGGGVSLKVGEAWRQPESWVGGVGWGGSLKVGEAWFWGVGAWLWEGASRCRWLLPACREWLLLLAMGGGGVGVGVCTGCVGPGEGAGAA